ncbi:MAG: hypothetical protein J3K34DRAFT_398640 [Monoraphidium minutum]|nr:MAG: hypothetical protein J3K34DRAFT_398640 [Monoraphidium minutum]
MQVSVHAQAHVDAGCGAAVGGRGEGKGRGYPQEPRRLKPNAAHTKDPLPNRQGGDQSEGSGRSQARPTLVTRGRQQTGGESIIGAGCPHKAGRRGPRARRRRSGARRAEGSSAGPLGRRGKAQHGGGARRGGRPRACARRGATRENAHAGRGGPV